MARSIFMPEMTNLEVQEYLDGGGRTVIVPVGSTEDHGDHDPPDQPLHALFGDLGVAQAPRLLHEDVAAQKDPEGEHHPEGVQRERAYLGDDGIHALRAVVTGCITDQPGGGNRRNTSA